MISGSREIVSELLALNSFNILNVVARRVWLARDFQRNICFNEISSAWEICSKATQVPSSMGVGRIRPKPILCLANRIFSHFRHDQDP